MSSLSRVWSRCPKSLLDKGVIKAWNRKLLSNLRGRELQFCCVTAFWDWGIRNPNCNKMRLCVPLRNYAAGCVVTGRCSQLLIYDCCAVSPLAVAFYDSSMDRSQVWDAGCWALDGLLLYCRHPITMLIYISLAGRNTNWMWLSTATTTADSAQDRRNKAPRRPSTAHLWWAPGRNWFLNPNFQYLFSV